jgi:excisionase family DNA binding protein
MARKQQESAVLTVREVARYLNIHVNTVRRWSDLGILEAHRIGPRRDRRFRREEVLAFLPKEGRDKVPGSDTQ